MMNIFTYLRDIEADEHDEQRMLRTINENLIAYAKIGLARLDNIDADLKARKEQLDRIEAAIGLPGAGKPALTISISGPVEKR